MKEAVQGAVQERDKAVQAEEAVTSVAWKPRTDGKTARLISERATFFDRDAAALKPADPVDEVRDPIFDHQEGMRWSPELVHCRLLVAGEIYMRLPERLRSGQLRSFLGNVAVVPSEGSRKAPPSPIEITIADWTFQQIYDLPAESRELLQARAFDVSFDKIVAAMKRRGMDARKSTVRDWARDVLRVLAADWARRKVPVDTLSFERWRLLFASRPK